MDTKFDEMVKQLKDLAKREYYQDDPKCDLYEHFGNEEDTFYWGEEQGEIALARQILGILEIDSE